MSDVISKPSYPEMPRPPTPPVTRGRDPQEIDRLNNEYRQELNSYNQQINDLMQRYREELDNYNKQQESQRRESYESGIAYVKSQPTSKKPVYDGVYGMSTNQGEVVFNQSTAPISKPVLQSIAPISSPYQSIPPMITKKPVYDGVYGMSTNQGEVVFNQSTAPITYPDTNKNYGMSTNQGEILYKVQTTPYSVYEQGTYKPYNRFSIKSIESTKNVFSNSPMITNSKDFDLRLPFPYVTKDNGKYNISYFPKVKDVKYAKYVIPSTSGELATSLFVSGVVSQGYGIAKYGKSYFNNKNLFTKNEIKIIREESQKIKGLSSKQLSVRISGITDNSAQFVGVKKYGGLSLKTEGTISGITSNEIRGSTFSKITGRTIISSNKGFYYSEKVTGIAGNKPIALNDFGLADTFNKGGFVVKSFTKRIGITNGLREGKFVNIKGTTSKVSDFVSLSKNIKEGVAVFKGGRFFREYGFKGSIEVSGVATTKPRTDFFTVTSRARPKNLGSDYYTALLQSGADKGISYKNVLSEQALQSSLGTSKSAEQSLRSSISKLDTFARPSSPILLSPTTSDYYGKGTYERTGGGLVPSFSSGTIMPKPISPTPSSSFGLSPTKFNFGFRKGVTFERPTTTITPKITPRINIRVDTGIKVAFRTIQLTKQGIASRITNFSPSSVTPFSFQVSETRITPFPFRLNFDLDLGIGSKKRGVIKPSYRYTPSFSAFVFNIKGKAPKGTETGLRLRPITKRYSFY